jgi:hypothetical protein
MTIGTRPFGTPAATTLTAMQYSHVADGLQAQAFTNQPTPAALAAINALITMDTQAALSSGEFSPTGPLSPLITPLKADGTLYIPRRGILKVFPGDYVAVDPTTGWPILVSASAANNASAWTLGTLA